MTLDAMTVKSAARNAFCNVSGTVDSDDESCDDIESCNEDKRKKKLFLHQEGEAVDRSVNRLKTGKVCQYKWLNGIFGEFHEYLTSVDGEKKTCNYC